MARSSATVRHESFGDEGQNSGSALVQRNRAFSWLASGYGALVAGVFVVAFSVPVLAGFQVGGLFSGLLGGSSNQVSLGLFPNAFVAGAQGAHLKIPNFERLNPTADGSFLLTAWFNLRRLPASGETIILLSKFEGSPRPRNGYALALQRDQRSLRPLVFWGDQTTVGRWYDFPEIAVDQRQWFMLALSFSEKRYLGLYLGTKGIVADGMPAPTQALPTEDMQLLGGYELSTEVIPASSSPLVIGAFADRPFRGLIGPVGVYTGNLDTEVRKALRAMVRAPIVPSSEINRDSRALWIPDSALDQNSDYVGPADAAFIAGRRDGEKI